MTNKDLEEERKRREKEQIWKGLKATVKKAAVMGFLTALGLIFGAISITFGIVSLVALFGGAFGFMAICIVVTLVSGTVCWIVAEVADYVHEVLTYGPRWP